MSEWKEYKLGDVCSRLRSGKNLKSNLIFPEGKYPVWGGNGVRGYTNECNFKGQCCVIGRQGAYCGNVHYYEGEAYMTEHAIVAVGNEQADTYYLACALSLMHLENLSAQSAQPGISVQTLSTQTIILPPIDEQKRIAGVLSSLDDKIDLLNRENATLEALAETLFRHYFIENPDPTWKEGKLGDEFDFTMGQSPSGDSFNEDGIGIPMYQGNADFGFRFPTRRVYTTAPTRFAEENDTLISVRAPVGAQNMASERCCIGRGVAAFRHKDKSLYSYTYYKLKSLLEDIRQFNDNGTVFGSISKSDFENIDIVIPNRDSIVAFQEQATPIDEKIRTNYKQILVLSAQRDSLLPRLMSGEVKHVE